jgi:hypothetical protein
VFEGIKIYLVSDATKFAITDVYHGYANAFKDLKVPYEEFPYHLFREILADPICYQVIHSSALQNDKGFTHVMFVGGMNVPDFIFDSLHGAVKSIVVATEDPHSFDRNKYRLGKIDYYFTNERSIAQSGRYPNMHYCPTAGCTHDCGMLPLENLDPKYRSDILFLGALYPNRQALLEKIIPFVEANNLTMKICGHINFYMPKKSPLRKYVADDRTIPHAETVKYYNGARAVINILRDIKWNPRTKSGKNPFNSSRFAAESLNPRAYEVPLCGGLQFLEDLRPEAHDVFTDDEVVFFSDSDSLVSGLQKYLLGDGRDRVEDMKRAAFTKVMEGHTYLHRAMEILKVLQK